VYSVVVPVYKNEPTLPAVVQRLEQMNAALDGRLEAVLVVDGSPDRSYAVLKDLLTRVSFSSQLVCLSRNFGSFSAIRQGMAVASGPYFAVMAADLQEPADLMLQFFRLLEAGDVDVTVGVRTGRADPFFSSLASRLFWGTYRTFIQRDVPPGGVDVFGCNLAVRDALLGLKESNSSLVGLLFWLGYRRAAVPYERLPREHGTSGWGFRRKVRYLFDSAFAFTDLPITALLTVGVAGVVLSVVVAIVVLVMWLRGAIPVLGYTPIVLLIVFSMSANLFGLGIVGSYIWRTFENSKGRPLYVPLSHESFGRDAD
jgi:glycosyltransferase involved in cell wall biosynthesis